MMTSFAGDLQFKIRSPKASGPGLTVRFADNRTGARMQAIIGIAFLKSSGIFAICTPPARRRFPFAAPRSQRMVGPAHPKRNREWGSRLTGLDLGQRHAPLSLVLPAAVFVGGLADFVRFDEDDLGHALVGIDLGRERRGVGELQRDVPLPFGLKRRDVDDDPAAGVSRLPQ